MVRAPYIDKKGLKRGAWSEEEDNKLRAYILRYKAWNWNLLPKFAGLARCGKSCRMRWENYLKPGVRRGGFSKDDEELILKMQKKHGNKWSLIAKRMTGRTDNEIKNYWHTILSMRTKKEQNSTGFIEHDIETLDQMHGIEQTKIDCVDSIQIMEHKDSESNTIKSSETNNEMLQESVPIASQCLFSPTINADSLELYDESFGSLVYEPHLLNSWNTEEALTTYSSFRLIQDLILNPEESFSATFDSFTSSETFLMDNSISKNSSSTSKDFCQMSMDFPSSSHNSRLETPDSWSPDENFFANSVCILEEPFSVDSSNMPLLEATKLETPTLLSSLDSLDSFGYWKALWNILN